jgi:tRNA(Ile2) C34 agmatinyltransferase TiaS
MKKPTYTRPTCPKCGTAMRLISTGSEVRTFSCDKCKGTIIVPRETAKKE